MAFPRLRAIDPATSDIAPARLTSGEDMPVASPVHALRDYLQNLIAPPQIERAEFDLGAAATRIALYVAAPLMLWMGIFRLVSLF